MWLITPSESQPCRHNVNGWGGSLWSRSPCPGLIQYRTQPSDTWRLNTILILLLISATLDSTAVDPVDDIDGTIGCNMKS